MQAARNYTHCYRASQTSGVQGKDFIGYATCLGELSVGLYSSSARLAADFASSARPMLVSTTSGTARCPVIESM